MEDLETITKHNPEEETYRYHAATSLDDAERILSADGIERIVGRGPDTLTVDGELSIDMTDENVIERELEQFNDLVDAINFFGMRLI